MENVFLNKLLNLNWGGLGPQPYMYSYNWLTSWLNKNLSVKFSSELLFTAKILQEAMCLTSPYMVQIIYN